MAVSDLSASTQDYLKGIWTLQEWHAGPVSVTALASRLDVRTSTVSDAVRKLAEAGLVEHEHYGGVTLTPAGTAHAVAMVRRHRLLETYLVQELGYDWDEVHDEAEVLEHAVSERLIAAIDARLGHPDRDPHGDPIPSADGAAHLPAAVPLAAAGPGSYVVARISDADPARLRRFADARVVPDAVVTVDAAGRVVVDDGGAAGVDSGAAGLRPAALSLTDGDDAAVWVTPAEPR